MSETREPIADNWLVENVRYEDAAGTYVGFFNNEPVHLVCHNNHGSGYWEYSIVSPPITFDVPVKWAPMGELVDELDKCIEEIRELCIDRPPAITAEEVKRYNLLDRALNVSLGPISLTGKY